MSLALQAAPEAPPARGNVHYLHLPAPDATVALPVHQDGRLLGVLFVDGAAGALQRADVHAAVAGHLQSARQLLEQGRAAAPALPEAAAEPALPRHRVRFHARDASVFVDDHYLIKGVAGALLWKFLNEYTAKGRTDFCYRELRLDPALRLPDLVDNLGARLTLLEQRLAGRCPWLRIVRKARGLIAIQVHCELSLSQG